MARQFQVIGADGRPEPRVKKSIALLLVRRLLAVQVAPFVIRKVHIRAQPGSLAREPIALKRHKRPMVYEHHIEPRIEVLTEANSEWMAYLAGYGTLQTPAAASI